MITLFDVAHGIRRKRRGGARRLAGALYSQCASAASAGVVHSSAGGSSELRSVHMSDRLRVASSQSRLWVVLRIRVSALLNFNPTLRISNAPIFTPPLQHCHHVNLQSLCNNFSPLFPSLPPFLTSFLFVCIVLHCIAELSMCKMVRGLGAQWWERGGSCCQCCASGQQYRSL